MLNKETRSCESPVLYKRGIDRIIPDRIMSDFVYTKFISLISLQLLCVPINNVQVMPLPSKKSRRNNRFTSAPIIMLHKSFNPVVIVLYEVN